MADHWGGGSVTQAHDARDARGATWRRGDSPAAERHRAAASARRRTDRVASGDRPSLARPLAAASYRRPRARADFFRSGGEPLDASERSRSGERGPIIEPKRVQAQTSAVWAALRTGAAPGR